MDGTAVLSYVACDEVPPSLVDASVVYGRCVLLYFVDFEFQAVAIFAASVAQTQRLLKQVTAAVLFLPP